jgi:hypothetical protein
MCSQDERITRRHHRLSLINRQSCLKLATGEITMKKVLFFWASIAMMDMAWGQMSPPTLGGTYAPPGGYSPPTFVTPGYRTPGYGSPGYAAPGGGPAYTAPGTKWREQRANEDWRNNTWREQRTKEDWRTNDWRQQRANEDWQAREKYLKEKTPNNAVDRGFVQNGNAIKNPDRQKDCGGTSAPPCAGDSSTPNQPLGQVPNQEGLSR